jgi:hypothetical protein
MGGSGKWVKSLIGLKKPEKEDCKVSVTGCSWFLEKERERETRIRFFHCFWVFSRLICVIMMEIFGMRVFFFFFGGIFPGQICGVVAQSLLFLELRYFRFDSRHRASKMNPLCPEWQRLCPSEQYAHRSVSFILRTFIS